MKRMLCIGLLLVLPVLLVAQEAEKEAFKGDVVEFTCQQPNTETPVPLQVTLPKGWKQNKAFGTMVFEPKNAGDYYEAPRMEFQIMCEGECKAEVIPLNIKKYMLRLMEGWKTLATGDPELDKQGTIVEVIKESQAEGQLLFAVKLTYPEGVSSAMYPPRYWIYLFLFNEKDPYFAFVKGKVPVSLKDEFLDDVMASCLTTVLK